MSDQSRTDPTKEKKSEQTQGQGGSDPSKVDPKRKSQPQPDPTASGSGSGSGSGVTGRPATPAQTGEGSAGLNDGSPHSQYSRSSDDSYGFDFDRGFGNMNRGGSGGSFATSGTTGGGTRGGQDYSAARMGTELKVGDPVIDRPCGMEDNNFGGGNGRRDGEH